MIALRIKDLKDAQKDINKTSLKKNLRAMDLVLLGLGGIIGTGIFVLTGLAAARYAGPSITLSFVLGGIASIFTALAYVELASMLPVAGSAFTYVYVTMGEAMASVVGWAALMVFTYGAAAVASGWSGYMVGILNGFGVHLPEALTKIPSEGGVINLPAVFIVVFLTLFLIRGMNDTTRLNGLLVGVKLGAILIFIVASIPHINPVNWEVFIPNGFSGVAIGAGFVFMAYTGFDTLATAAEECENPNRDLPIGIIGSLLGSIILYVIVAGVLTSIVPFPSLNNSEPMASALRAHGIHMGAKLVATGAVAAMTTVILTQIYGQSRILMVMARDGLVPKCFARINKKYATPHVGLLVTGLVIVLITGFAPVATLGQLSSMATLIVFSLVSVGVMILRYKMPNEKRTFVCPAVYWVASISAGLCLFLFCNLLTENWKLYLLSTLVGLAVYAFYGYRNSEYSRS